MSRDMQLWLDVERNKDKDNEAMDLLTTRDSSLGHEHDLSSQYAEDPGNSFETLRLLPAPMAPRDREDYQ